MGSAGNHGHHELHQRVGSRGRRHHLQDRSLAPATRIRHRRGRPFDTVTVTGTLEPTLLATSKAWAVRVWAPLVAVVVSQTIEYGGAVTSPPRATPSSLNWTVMTPTLSEAVADTITAEPDTVAPSPGAVRTIVGAEVSDPAGGTPEIAPAVAASSAVIFAPTSLRCDTGSTSRGDNRRLRGSRSPRRRARRGKSCRPDKSMRCLLP